MADSKTPSSQFFSDGSTIYTMLCKKGPLSSHINFKANSQSEAESISREYCKTWGLRFIWVESFLFDLSMRPKVLDKIYGTEIAENIEKEKKTTV